ncbi:uncharacterized protein LOC141706641 [Apium graveolens]|uniref:uncharacterized protein LOC141706641 n=1 Tax=Apium graveolens TaxID=4045 RepID=UPI003D78EAEC
METYEGEGETIPDCVMDYYTVDGSNQYVPFSVLPLLWNEDETPGNSNKQIFLCGTAMTGQKMCTNIIAWRPEISYALPEIYVLTENKLWMQLERPRKSFEEDIMSTLVTVHCLHFLKRHLKADGSALWIRLHEAFSTFEVAPSKSHLQSHRHLIQEAAKRDKDLAESELLLALLLETLTCQADRAAKKIKFEADSQDDYEDTNDKQLNIDHAPSLDGKRYKSYGRHFTEVSKLEVIVDRLKWYVQDGDTVVDFCCGANDFSCLMRERLHEMGKICSFKNYDLLTPKNDFNFELKNWMTVTVEELPAGSNLIVVLNPPFGVDGCLANKFIDKALTFKPKLLILMVPIETERLDRKKNSPYDIIWEEQWLLPEKAFHLPVSVDVNSRKLEQHNNLEPPFYLWSRPDWTAKRKTIAETCRHGTVAYDQIQMGKMDTRQNHDGMYEDMELDQPIYFPSSADPKNSHERNWKSIYPSRSTTGMQHSSGVSNTAAMGMQPSYSQGIYPSRSTTGMQHSSGVSDTAAMGMQPSYSQGIYPSRSTTGMQQSSAVSDTAAKGMQPSYLVSDAMQGVYHDDLPKRSSSASSVEGQVQGDCPFFCGYPTEPYFYPEWSGF